VRAWAGAPLRDRALPGREDHLAVVRDAQIVAEPAPAAAPVPALNPPKPHELRAARAQGEESLRECREARGPDHPDTLASAATLAVVLRAAGDVRAARDLNEDTLERLRQVLGPDHPDTLAVAHALAGDCSLLGDFDAARKLYGDTHNRLHTLRRARSRPAFICGTSLLLDRNPRQ
jgi:hypothetical protein